MKTKCVVAALTLLLSAAPAAAEAATCTPAGTALSIAAKDKKFDKDCLAAPAGEAFTIEFDNQDLVRGHNVSIYEAPGSSKALFTGEVFSGPDKRTYSVPAQVAGTYEFRCDPHDDTMIGTFIVS